jgi:hypothetical protein
MPLLMAAAHMLLAQQQQQAHVMLTLEADHKRLMMQTMHMLWVRQQR